MAHPEAHPETHPETHPGMTLNLVVLAIFENLPVGRSTPLSGTLNGTLSGTLRMHYLEGPTLSPHNGLGWYRDCSIRVSMIV